MIENFNFDAENWNADFFNTFKFTVVQNSADQTGNLILDVCANQDEILPPSDFVSQLYITHQSGWIALIKPPLLVKQLFKSLESC